jgi:hypothetical protein
LLWKKLKEWINWLLSFCIEVPEEESPYSKIDVNKKTIRYRIDGSKNEISMGPRRVNLEDIVFPDKNEDLGDMLAHIMEKEGIDIVQTHNLLHAWALWSAGLTTEEGIVPFKPEGKDPLDTLITSVLQKGEEPKLVHKIAARVLLAAAEEAKTAKAEKRDPHEARQRVASLEKVLKRKIDFKQVRSSLPRSSHKKIQKLLKEGPSASAAASKMTFEVPIRYLFPLLEASKEEIKRTMTRRLPLTQFTKG